MIEVLTFANPVALAALGETVSQRGGVINIGLEGTMLNGAFFALLGAQTTGSPWLGLLTGVAAGLLTALLFGVFTIKLLADQVVTGTAINLLALGLTSAIFRGRFGESGQLLSVPKVPSWNGLDPVLIFAILCIPAITYALQKTSWGLFVRASGEYPPAAEAAGQSVVKLRFQALSVGGVLGGLAGAYLSLGIAGSFAENMTAGRGFVAIAMVTFGRWRPIFVYLAALLIGYAESLQFVFQAKGWQVPFQLLIAMPYLLALAVLVFVGKGTSAPQALGHPYKKER